MICSHLLINTSWHWKSNTNISFRLHFFFNSNVKIFTKIDFFANKYFFWNLFLLFFWVMNAEYICFLKRCLNTICWGFHIAPIILFLDRLLHFKVATAKSLYLARLATRLCRHRTLEGVVPLRLPQEERKVPSLGIWRTEHLPSMTQDVCKDARNWIWFSWGKAPDFLSTFSLWYTLRGKDRWVTCC